MIAPPRRIVAFRALYLGDLLVAVPALRALRVRYPAAEITFIGLPWSRSFIERFPRYVDRWLEFPGFEGLEGSLPDPARVDQFLREARAQQYDLAIQMHGSGETSNRFILALEAQQATGYYRDSCPAGLTPALPYPRSGSEVERNLALAALVGCRQLDTRLEFPLWAEDEAEAWFLLGGRETQRPLIGIHPGSKTPSRRWPAEYFARTADLLAHNGADIVLTGSPDEEDLVRDVAAQMETTPVIAAGKTSLGGLAALIGQFDLFISNDTGPAHLAEARETRSIVLVGPTELERWAPLDRSLHRVIHQPVACAPCLFWECPIDHRCLRHISPDEVVTAANEMLRQRVPA